VFYPFLHFHPSFLEAFVAGWWCFCGGVGLLLGLVFGLFGLPFLKLPEFLPTSIQQPKS